MSGPSREASTVMLPVDPRPASNAILETSGVPKIFPATASEYCTAAYYGHVDKLGPDAKNEDLYKTGFVYNDGDKKSPAGLFHVKDGQRDAKELDKKPFTLISLAALQDSSEDTTATYALPPLFYARAAGQRDAVLALHKHACDEQANTKTNFIYTVHLDMKLKKWIVEPNPLRRSAFEVAVENGFEKGSGGAGGDCRMCEASQCTVM